LARKALVVDDDQNIKRLISFILDQMEFEVEYASNGEEALNIFRQNNYDLILMDVLMPKIDGFSVVEKMRQMEANIKHTPIIVISAIYTKGKYRSEATKKGADLLISKPFQPQDLMDKIQHLLNI
jgi:CheY-like chemotaxis protein